MNARQLALFLRSRRAGVTLACLVASAAATWGLLGAIDERMLIKLTLIILPLTPAVALGVGQHSPFGELERTASAGLPALRLAQLAGLLAVAGGTLVAANSAAWGDDFRWLLVRNAAGYAGLALVGGFLTGASFSWALPLAYGLFVVIAPVGDLLERESRWLWPIHPPAERPAILIAAVLLLLGVAIAATHGARTRSDEGS